jgi:hypothetical protein
MPRDLLRIPTQVVPAADQRGRDRLVRHRIILEYLAQLFRVVRWQVLEDQRDDAAAGWAPSVQRSYLVS